HGGGRERLLDEARQRGRTGQDAVGREEAFEGRGRGARGRRKRPGRRRRRRRRSRAGRGAARQENQKERRGGRGARQRWGGGRRGAPQEEEEKKEVQDGGRRRGRRRGGHQRGDPADLRRPGGLRLRQSEPRLQPGPQQSEPAHLFARGRTSRRRQP